MQYLLSEDLIKYIENNTDLLDISATDFIENAYKQPNLHLWEISDLMRMLHDSKIDFDTSVIPNLTGYPNYDFSFKPIDEILNDLYSDTFTLTKEIKIQNIDKISADVLHYNLINDDFLSRCYIKTTNWKEAKGPYIITIGVVCKESDQRLYTCLTINSANLLSSIELYYPKIIGKILDNVGYMYNKTFYDKQAVTFENGLTRIIETILKEVYKV